jgi:hypothetical protein
MTTHTTSGPGTTFTLDERVLKAIAILGVVVLLIPAVAPLATGGSPGYYLYKEYATSDNPDDSMREDGAAAGTAGGAMMTGGGLIMKTTSATSAAYIGGAAVTGGSSLVISGGIILG